MYDIHADKPGFAQESEGLPQTSLSELTSSKRDRQVRLSPLAVISGRVLDDSDRPMRGTGITLLSSTVQAGRRVLRTTRHVTTDDQDEYRFWNVDPRRYYVKASGQGGGNLLSGTLSAVRLPLGDSFDPQYPDGGKTATSSSPLNVTAGMQVKFDFRLKLLPAFEVRGRLTNTLPGAAIDFTLLVNGEEVRAAPDLYNAQTGAFVFQDVVSGSYVLRAAQNGQAGEARFAVDGANIDRVEIAMAPFADTPVSIHFEGTPPVPAGRDPRLERSIRAVSNCIVSLTEELPPGSMRGAVGAYMSEGALKGMAAGQNQLSVLCFGGYVRSVTAGGGRTFLKILYSPLLLALCRRRWKFPQYMAAAF